MENNKLKKIIQEEIDKYTYNENLKKGFQLISESSLNRILSKHYNNGFIIISSFRNIEEKTKEENSKDFKDLKQKVKSSGFSFIPVYGGYIENKGTETEKEVLEPALLVPNYKIGSDETYKDENKIKQLGVNLAKEFNQDDFLFKPKNTNNSYYIDKQGNVKMEFKNKTINDLTQIYFTDLSNKYKGKESKLNKTSNVPKKFSFTESLYLNNSPVDLNEARSRYGELFFNL